MKEDHLDSLDKRLLFFGYTFLVSEDAEVGEAEEPEKESEFDTDENEIFIFESSKIVSSYSLINLLLDQY